MNEFIEKLINRLEEKSVEHRETGFEMERKGFSNIADKQYAKQTTYLNAIAIVNQLAEEYNNDFCKWNYDEFEEKWQTDCGVLFTLHDSDREITNYCPYCGKKIKIAPYQPKGE